MNANRGVDAACSTISPLSYNRPIPSSSIETEDADFQLVLDLLSRPPSPSVPSSSGKTEDKDFQLAIDQLSRPPTPEIALDGRDDEEDDRKPPAKLAVPSGGSTPVMIPLPRNLSPTDSENSPGIRKMKREGWLSSSTACKSSDDLFGSQATDREQKLQRRREKKRRALSKAEEADYLLACALQEQVSCNLFTTLVRVSAHDSSLTHRWSSQEDRAGKKANSQWEERLMQKSNEGRAGKTIYDTL